MLQVPLLWFAGGLWQLAQLAAGVGCANAQLTPALWWQLEHAPERWLAGRRGTSRSLFETGWVNAKLLPGPALWQSVHAPVHVCAGFALVGGVWHVAQLLLIGCVNFQSTPGPLRWHRVQSPVHVCGGVALAGGVWHVAQSGRCGCVKTNFGPGAWHTVQSVGRF